MRRYAILADGNFDYVTSKTGNAILRYRPEEAVCVIDSYTAGMTAREVLGWGSDAPIVPDIREALAYSPNTLLIGIAPPGGELPAAWRGWITFAIKSNLDIISGLHRYLSDDPEFSSLASRHGVTIVDLRRPPDILPFLEGSWQNREKPVLMTVGTDCNTGKMTTAWEIKELLEKRGKRVGFVGTGQTGLLLGGYGVAVDAVKGDFISGVVEAEIDKAVKENDFAIVEGQGSLTHQAYSGVTLGLLHGTMPDLMVLCHEPGRVTDSFGHPMFPAGEIMDLYLKLTMPFKPSRFVGVSLITQNMTETLAMETVKTYARDYGIPAADFFRFGGETVAAKILEFSEDLPA
ncbi:MAG: DUF1611 domain-containing protein [Candidatus Neomarinimicrobiota bacterium]